MNLPEIDTDYLQEFLLGLLNTPSPTGFAEAGVAYTGEALLSIPGLEITRTPKGALMATWQGQHDDQPRALTAHADTLGGMVKEIKTSGRLKLSLIGGIPWNTIEGENATIFTARGEQFRGSVLLTKASGHAYGRSVVEETKRNEDTIEIRLDAQTTSSAQTRDLGIDIGDFIAFDPRVEVVNGFIRSRHLDDKAGVACILSAIKTVVDGGLMPVQQTHLLISNYEEVGHGGAASIPETVTELVTVDMAVIAEGQNSDEHHATLCVKDSHGPYHHGLSQRLRQLAETYQIPYKVDIYPFYGSDGSSYWFAGGTGAVALIGPGIDASHNYERTHLDALVATTKWIMAYLLN